MEKTQRNNIMLAFITLAGAVAIVSIIGFFTLGKGTEIIQGEAEATEYRVSSKVPGRVLKFFVHEGDKVKVNLPIPLVKAGLRIGMGMPQVKGNAALESIDFGELIALIDSGVIGKLVEVESADGDIVEITVE